jgi:hypothetical protein
MVEACLVLSVLVIGGCRDRDGHSEIIRNTIEELRATAEFYDSDDSDETRSYLAPAFRAAIPVLEKDGTRALPTMIAASFYYSPNAPASVNGWVYLFSWLDVQNDVRGYYLRSDGESDVEINPEIPKEPQVPGTAWMVGGGPIVHNDNERSEVPGRFKGLEMVVDVRVLKRKRLSVGLILADGRKTTPVQAGFIDRTVKRDVKKSLDSVRP